MALTQKRATVMFLYLAAAAACSPAQIETATPTLETITARMAQARAENRIRFRPYVVRRDYKLFDGNIEKAKSEVTADVTFVPPDSKKYAIQRTTGSGLGERIVRRALESEAEVAKDQSTTDVSLVNYAFRFVREGNAGGRRCYVLELLPRRAEKNLLRGHAWVDADTYLLHRADGQPAKKLSWWLRDVRITLFYKSVGGMWLQTASESTANIRILGHYRLVSRDVEYKMGELAGLAGQSALVE